MRAKSAGPPTGSPSHLGRLGLSAELIETAGHPIVYAESPPVPGAPTVLVYGHYDVQPADPLDQWITPPFEPTVRDGNIYARGATDDKGQMLTHVKSAQAWLETAGRLPVQLKFLIEGEEEVGSENLNKLLETAADKLACDVVVISDTSQFGPGQPAITYGLQGIAYFELRLNGPKQDLHSGTFGGAVTNPANALARMLTALVDDQGRIQLPGFYDDVVPLTDRERAQFAALPFDDQEFMARIGVEAVTGEAGYTTLERRWARPTFDINGLWGGYQGEGGKTVLPSAAGAKFSFRLVPNQDPQRVAAALREMLTRICPPGIRMELIEMHGAPGVVVSLDSPYVQAATRAIELRLWPPAGVHSRRRLDSHRDHLSRASGRRFAAAGLGPGRRQRPRPERKILAGRFPPRNPSQRLPLAGTRRIKDRPCSIANSLSITPMWWNSIARTATRKPTSGRLVEMEGRRRNLLTEVQELNRRANDVSKTIGQAKSPEEREARKEEGRQLRQQKDAAQAEHDRLDAEITAIQVTIPNVSHPAAPVGVDDQANRELRRGRHEPRKFDFTPLDHVQLCEKLDLLDLEGGARTTGHGFYFLRNEAVLLELAFQRYALEVLMAEGSRP